MSKLIIISIAVLQIQTAVSQCLNRQANVVFNRPETIVEAPSPTLVQPAVIENPNFVPPLSFSSPTTIITDCSPSVCQNLVNTIQLMIVCNLLRNTREGSELAAQLTSPIISELSSPTFPCGCPNPLINLPPNIVSSNLLPSNLLPNFVVPSNMNSMLPVTPNLVSNINSNALFGNYMNIFK